MVKQLPHYHPHCVQFFASGHCRTRILWHNRGTEREVLRFVERQNRNPYRGSRDYFVGDLCDGSPEDCQAWVNAQSEPSEVTE